MGEIARPLEGVALFPQEPFLRRRYRVARVAIDEPALGQEISAGVIGEDGSLIVEIAKTERPDLHQPANIA